MIMMWTFSAVGHWASAQRQKRLETFPLDQYVAGSLQTLKNAVQTRAHLWDVGLAVSAGWAQLLHGPPAALGRVRRIKSEHHSQEALEINSLA